MAVLQLGNYLFLFQEIAGLGIVLKFFCASSLLGMVAWTVISALRDALGRTKRMYQIPCTKCRFFTNDYRLKCTMNPYAANTEEAIDCSDYISN